ncbi:MAG: ABC transporter substrate-binding protein [Coriobacteriia bacterium]|nr:ABC transporter substrate-binding protein [Coriobacteriia bacterium]
MSLCVSRRSFIVASALLASASLLGGRVVLAAEEGSSGEPERTTAADLPRIGGPTMYPYTYTTYTYDREPVEYTVEKAPERVVAIDQNNIETLLALGLKDAIVCAFGLDDPSALGDLQADFEQIPYQDAMPPKEDVIALSPDFISGWYSTFSDDRLGNVDFWQGRGCGTYMSLNSACRGKTGTYYQTIYDEMRDIQQLGIIFDKQDAAQALVDEMLDEVLRIQDYTSQQSTHPRVAVLENEDDSFRVYSEMTLGGNVAMEAGAELAAGKGSDTANISAEDLIGINPDAIFMVWYDGFKTGEEAVADITDNPKFASLTAVKEGRVFPLALTGIYCSGLHTIDGILDISEALYPELYEEGAAGSAVRDAAAASHAGDAAGK